MNGTTNDGAMDERALAERWVKAYDGDTSWSLLLPEERAARVDTMLPVVREHLAALGVMAADMGRMRHNYTTSPMATLATDVAAAMGMDPDDVTAADVLSRVRRMFAPVDVEAKVDVLTGAVLDAADDETTAFPEVVTLLRPPVEERARLAREVEHLQAETANARAEVVKLAAERDDAMTDLWACGGELQTCRATLAEERRDVDRLGLELAAARGEAADWAARFRQAKEQAEAARAEIERVGRSEAACVREALEQVGALRAEIARLTAAPGEAWERAWRAFVQACGYTQPIERLSMGWVIELAKAKKALPASLTFVEPRADTIAADPGAGDAGRRTTSPIPPRPLTEAEARGLAEHIGTKLGLAKDEELPVDVATRAILGWYAARGEIPPRALTEAEARTWSAIALRTGGVRVLDVAAALLAASRGDVPPEVRPVKCTACNGHEVVRHDGHDSEGWANEGPCPVCCATTAKPEMAVTTGEDAPDSVYPRVLCPGCSTGGEGAHARSARCSGCAPGDVEPLPGQPALIRR